jgi:hypothetical protein
VPSSSSPEKVGAGARWSSATTVAVGVGSVNSYSPVGLAPSFPPVEQPASAPAAAPPAASSRVRRLNGRLIDVPQRWNPSDGGWLYD